MIRKILKVNGSIKKYIIYYEYMHSIHPSINYYDIENKLHEKYGVNKIVIQLVNLIYKKIIDYKYNDLWEKRLDDILWIN